MARDEAIDRTPICAVLAASGLVYATGSLVPKLPVLKAAQELSIILFPKFG
jgi:hypothetical protein